MRRAPHLLTLLATLFVGCSSDPELGPSAPRPSTGTTNATFKADVYPILSESCALTACHASKQSSLGIHITYDAAQVYAELQKESPTFPGTKFVVPGKPDESFLLLKMEGKQGSRGREMPPDDLLPDAKVAIVRAWIGNGAKND